MPGEKYKIITIRDVPSGDPNRIGKLDVMVVYQKEGQPSNMCTFPKEEESEERIKQAIQETEKRLTEWTGKEFII